MAQKIKQGEGMEGNIFEMGAKFEDGWVSDNKEKGRKPERIREIETPSHHKLFFTKEKRRGKIVTIVQPFWLEKDLLQSLLKRLKKRLGTGGTLRENRLEFQGDISESLRQHLLKLDFGMR